MATPLQREELASWLQDASLKPHVDYMIIDVRDADFANGARPDEHKPLLSVPKRLVFHCLLSQVRGPKSANVYLNREKYGNDKSLTENYNSKFWANGGYDY
ncbi:hypothetical protein BDR26DRAFT_929085 [Obelidium mucronatum]|nr:hypothetical protein BDR26DRAFT_929085 [Obelidium mucronatum]